MCLQLPEPNKAENLVVSVRTVSSLTVTWDAGDGENSGFTVRLDSGIEVAVPKDTTRTHTFDSLTAGQEYTVTVVTKSGDETSTDLTGNFRTSKCLIFLASISKTLLPSAERERERERHDIFKIHNTLYYLNLENTCYYLTPYK